MNFQKLCERAERYKETREEPRLIMYKSQNGSFWDTLMQISSGGNIEGLAQLLNTSSDQIRRWPSLIRQAKLEYEDQQVQNKKDIMMPTGKIGNENGKNK